MYSTIRKAIAPSLALPIEWIVSVGTLFAFLWLLAQGYIQPIAIYLLELYLTF